MLVASGRTKAPAGGPNAKHSADLEPASHGSPLTRNTGNLNYAARAHATRGRTRCPRPFGPRARLIFWGSSDSEMAMFIMLVRSARLRGRVQAGLKACLVRESNKQYSERFLDFIKDF